MQRICIVIPCYNEALRLSVPYLTGMLDSTGYTVLAVNDGSMDNTADILKSIAGRYPERFHVLNLPQNAGKAEAVRQGMLHVLAHVPCDYAGYWDADFSTPLEEIGWFQYFSGGTLQHNLIMGSRMARMGAVIIRRPLRHYTGRCFATVVSMMLNLPVYDTQCGAKLIRTTLLDVAFAERFESRWLFDVEIIFRLKNHAEKLRQTMSLLEVPLRKWTEIGGSKLKPGDFLSAPFTLRRIWKRYGRKRRR